MKEPLVHVHIADIHFGCNVDPDVHHTILREQFIYRINQIHFDVLSIDGDLFDRKLTASSRSIECAIMFVKQCLDLCLFRGATLIIIAGTHSHDAGQLSVLRHLEISYPHNFIIVDAIRFVYVNGYKILCIPEEYGKGSWYYERYLMEEYDMVFMHGTIAGAIYGKNREDLNSNREPVFSIDSFSSCKGPIICGHVHKAMCLNQYIYYVSDPIRHCFGEEEAKGFAICLSSPDGSHYYNFVPIESFNYTTITLRDIASNDPDTIVSYIENRKELGADFVRLDLSQDAEFAMSILKVLEQRFAQDPRVTLKKPSQNKDAVTQASNEEISAKYADMEFLLDPKLSNLERFVYYVNHCSGCEFITIDGMKKLLNI